LSGKDEKADKMLDTSEQIRTYFYDALNKNSIPKCPRAVALGMFDGVHLGHRAAIMNSAGVEIESGGWACSSVFTFASPPFKENAWELISLKQKKAVLTGLGVDELILVDFESVRQMTPEQFVRDILKEKLDARRVCCGFNYRFGKDGSGDADTLRRLCQPLGIEVVVIPPVTVDGEPVSSSRIRRLIEDGEIERAARLLGRPFTLDIEVTVGQRLGRLLGTPTINQVLPASFVRPKFGVYLSTVVVDGVSKFGVTNIGVRPTVGADRPLAETWIIDFDGDLYGRHIPVTLVKYLRGEKKFDSLDQLKQQILEDAKTARAVFLGGGTREGQPGTRPVKAVLFDFDDTLQNRKAAFTKYSRFFLKKYCPSLTGSELEEKVEYMVERNHDGYVNYIEYLKSLYRDWGWEDAPPAEEAYRELQMRFPEFTTLLPDTVDTLKKLRQMGYKVGVITNGPSLNQNRKLDISGIRPLLDLAMVSGDEEVRKPDKEIFRRAAFRLGVPCESCVYVGDHHVNDIEGASGAGMKPVCIDVHGDIPKTLGVPVITSLSEIFELLKQA
jgi:riboflavin kinase/FMN adenylyltransferase